MGEDEVLPARLADDARVGSVVGDIVADRFPHSPEDRSGTGEVDAGEVRAGHDRVPDLRARTGDEVDDAGREARFFHELQQMPAGEDGGRSGFPEDGVAHQSGRGG